MRRGNKWVKYFWLAAVLYAFYTVGRLAYKNYQFNLEEAQLREDVARLEVEIQDLKNQIVYYQSDSYKEKMIRAKLGLKKEGEEVIVITPEPEAEKVDNEEVDTRTNPEKWLAYFFGANK